MAKDFYLWTIITCNAPSPTNQECSHYFGFHPKIEKQPLTIIPMLFYGEEDDSDLSYLDFFIVNISSMIQCFDEHMAIFGRVLAFSIFFHKICHTYFLANSNNNSSHQAPYLIFNISNPHHCWFCHILSLWVLSMLPLDELIINLAIVIPLFLSLKFLFHFTF